MPLSFCLISASLKQLSCVITYDISVTRNILRHVIFVNLRISNIQKFQKKKKKQKLVKLVKLVLVLYFNI